MVPGAITETDPARRAESSHVGRRLLDSHPQPGAFASNETVSHRRRDSTQPATNKDGSMFDQNLSHRIDRVIAQLDSQPSRLRRFALRVIKRWLERGVPCN